jgi:hypothetical protein
MMMTIEIELTAGDAGLADRVDSDLAGRGFSTLRDALSCHFHKAWHAIHFPFRPISIVLFLLLVAQCASAAEWQSADGNISVTIPEASRFVKGEAVPPISVVWVATDETIKLAVAEVPFRHDMKLIQSSLEGELAKLMGGRIVASSTERQLGHDIMLMTAYGEMFGTETYITQAIVAVGDKVYKVMACGLGRDTRVDPDAKAFLSSFRLLPSSQIAGSPSANRRTNAQSARTSPESDAKTIDMLSGKIGGIALLLLLIATAISRSATRRKQAEHNSA